MKPKKNSLTFLFFLLIPFLSMGQAKFSRDFSYEISSPYQVVDAPYKYYFYQDNEVLTVKINGRRILLQKFDSELNFVNDKVYEDFPDGFEVEDVLEVDRKFYFFYSVWDRANETEQLLCSEIDFATGSFKGERKLLVKVDKKLTGNPIGRVGFWSFGVTDKFDIQFSHDKSKMLVQYRVKPEVRNDDRSYDLIGLNVFDEKINLIWEREIKMPYTEKKMNILDYSIDSEGNTYILSSVYNDDTTDAKKEKEGNPNYRIELFRIKANSDDINITPISLENKFISRLWIYESPDNSMICAGYYNNGDKMGAANGVMIFRVGKDGDLYDQYHYEIPVSILNQNVSARVERKNTRKEEKDKAEFEDLELRKCIIGEDGSLLLIGEQYYVTQYTYYSNGVPHTSYYYHYNDMLVTKIDKNGVLSWMRKLPKRQTGGSGRGGMSYEYIFDEKANNHYVLFLDNVDNVLLPLDKVPAVHRDGAGGFLTAFKIGDATGDVNKVSILDTRDVNGIAVYQFYPRKIFPLGPGEFAFEVYKKRKEDIMIKVALRE